jgi:micrococcal nuclease
MNNEESHALMSRVTHQRVLKLLLALCALWTLSSCEQSPDGRSNATTTSDIPVATGNLSEVPPRDPVEVIDVIDGDTIEVQIDGEIELVRLIGINSPETDGPYREAECYGSEATALATAAIGSARIVYLEQDQTNRDQFDRLLRYVWLETGAANLVLLNELLVSRGAAYARAYPPDVRHQSRLTDAENMARRGDLGLWGACA